jgi:hypothetical protein
VGTATRAACITSTIGYHVSVKDNALEVLVAAYRSTCLRSDLVCPAEMPMETCSDDLLEG